MSTKSAPGSEARAGAHRVLRCAGGVFVPNAILTIAQADPFALRPPLTPLEDGGVAPNNSCACRRGPGLAELNGSQST